MKINNNNNSEVVLTSDIKNNKEDLDINANSFTVASHN